MIETRKINKTISIILVLALVAGCFVTAFTPTANAATIAPIRPADLPETAIELDAVYSNSNSGNNALRAIWQDVNGVYVLVEHNPSTPLNSLSALNGVSYNPNTDLLGQYTLATMTALGLQRTTTGPTPIFSLIVFRGASASETNTMNLYCGNGGGNMVLSSPNVKIVGLVTVNYYANLNTIERCDVDFKQVMDNDVAHFTIKDCAVENEGYEFCYWTDADGMQYKSGDEIDRTENLDLYAVWNAVDYNIDYVLNGGTNDLTNPTTYTVESPLITLEAPTKAGYNFVEWTPVDNIPAGSIGDREFTAVWTAKSDLVISYDANTGTGSMDNTPATYDAKVILRANAFTKTGYNFAGWNTEADGSGDDYTDEQEFVYQIDGNLKLYAQWTAKPYAIEFLLGDTTMGDKLVGETNFPVNYDDVMPVPPYPYAIFGYKFVGWKGNDGSYVEARDYTKPTELTGYPDTVTGSVTYTAQWDLINPKQTFPDKIPSETHFDQWWDEYGVLCVSSSTTKNDNQYEVYFTDWFFDVFGSCTISFGSNANKIDYAIKFYVDTEDGQIHAEVITNVPKTDVTGVPNVAEKLTVNREGSKSSLKKTGEQFGDLYGFVFPNLFGSGAKLAWLSA